MTTNTIPKRSTAQQSLISVAVVCIMAIICFFLSSFVGYRVIALLLLMTVSICAMFFDILPVLLTAVLSAFIWDFFFIPPRFTFSVNDPEDLLMLLMYFVIALLNAVLTIKIRQIEKEANIKEEKANTIKLYNTLLNSLSHELKTPITTIIGASDNLMANNLKLTEENKNYLVADIATAADRLDQQVSNLLNMSRIESGFIKPKLDWTDIKELVYSSIHHLEKKSENHQLVITIPDNLPFFKLDFGLIEHAISNLVHNAILYTPEKTVITIKVLHKEIVAGHFSDDDTMQELQRDRKVDLLTIIISDNGIGFPEEKINKAFDKFYRINSSVTGGTGLGLSIVKGFVQAHYGTIKLENNKAGGATFTIEIPAETSYMNQLKNE